MLSEGQVRQIFSDTQADIKVVCDEYHVHTAEGGCLQGPKYAVEVLKLCETLFEIQRKLKLCILGGR